MTDKELLNTQDQKRRTRGLGSLILRGRIWRIRFYVNGRRVDQSSGSEKQSVAAKLLKQRLAELATGRFAPNADRVTVGELFTMLAADGVAKGNRSRRKLTHLCDAFDVVVKTAEDGTVSYNGGWKAVALTTDRIRAYEAERLGKGVARATVNQELAALRRAFNLALEAGRLATKPVIKTPDPKNARKGFVTDRQFEAVRGALPDSLQGVWAFAFLTGWRTRSEILPLQWTNVDWRRGVVRIEDSKNGEPREFPFAEYGPLKAVLTAQKATTRGPYVFHDGEGKPVIYDRWNDARQKACTAVGVDAIAHDLRRTAVRNLERAGVSRSVAMSLTGHKTEAVYRRYAIVDSSAQREGVAKLAKAQVGYSSGTNEQEEAQ